MVTSSLARGRTCLARDRVTSCSYDMIAPKRPMGSRQGCPTNDVYHRPARANTSSLVSG